MARRVSASAAVAVGGSTTVVAMLPVFLTGALAVQIRDELGFGVAGIGAAVAAFRGGGALTAVPFGRLADRLGAVRSLRVALLVAGSSLLAIAVAAVNLATLVAFLLVASCANTLGQPGANRLLLSRVAAGRRGLAFGLKQSAPPTAALLGGLSIPLVALTVGWRWAYALAACLALAVIPFVRRRPAQQTANDRRPAGHAPLGERDKRILGILSLAFGFSAASSSVVTSFFVDFAVGEGMLADAAGTFLAVASFGAIVVRLLSGALADHLRSRHLAVSSALLGLGGLGLFALATANLEIVGAAVVVALAGVWGFNAVLWYAVTGAFWERPGRATGAINAGGQVGSMLGPLALGFVAEAFGYQAVWTAAAMMALGGCLGMALGARELGLAFGR